MLGTYIQPPLCRYFGDLSISPKESGRIRICITGTNLDRAVVRVCKDRRLQRNISNFEISQVGELNTDNISGFYDTHESNIWRQ
jgi:hypothetical protein